MGQQCPNSMCINPISHDEVVNIMKSCKPNHSKDCDDINMHVLSKVTDQIVKLLVHIFNLSFSSGIFPSEMKTDKVIPLFRSGNQIKLNQIYFDTTFRKNMNTGCLQDNC